MRNLGRVLAMGLLGFSLQVGCRDNTPAVPRVAPPELGRDTARREVDYAKPLPGPGAAGAPAAAPFYDEPLVVDQPPEAKPFVEIYNKVGRPHIAVFVNRTLDGKLLPAQDAGAPERVTERSRRSTGAMSVERNEFHQNHDAAGGRTDEDKDKFDAKGPVEYNETTTVYLRPGEYDELKASAIDYNMIENQLADWLGADGRVTIVSPALAQRKLTDQQRKDLQEGRPGALAGVAESLDADVLVQVQARPTKQTGQGLEMRMVAESIDVRGGESLARAAVDMYTPMDKYTVNRFTRFVARKLMDGMTQTWSQPRRAGDQPAVDSAPRRSAVPSAPGPAKAPADIVLPPLPPPTLPSTRPATRP